ncbi:MAG TPA: bifunctional (p)ppGpp synthetase/guanosine-3',5'-bis(diphosphate) 3'-pyrophosphohydrolase [Accumulibacter sp.]|uniref:RelA/SpoT family protein n=1 Tax=Accumulibacter sp. TaxID=2053492 RepID=UPI002C101D7D|nr:bifunctional (p)ppGpp synthetase/guanosine-3',5'-bis(diphosphate) 3'-pyrophosphohydrolase [Accumulibacter sp.]HRF72843.1 bifunctional (p)ppGpp synthetase/guanosine-3',5'-bis(diphosphate) 3'-pyrophosphohydrolase [Accumulibacter sp.]
MVSVTHSVAALGDFEDSWHSLGDGLSAVDGQRLRRAVDFARSFYGDRLLGSGEEVWGHALGMALIVAGLKLDADSRLAALLFAVPAQQEHGLALIEKDFGRSVAHLVDGISRLNRVRPITRGFVAHAADSSDKKPQEIKAQIEVLRKMLLAMVEDIRVVLLRLASRTQTLRYYANEPDPLRVAVARETLELYSPLANRLGVWELKWELEDLSFRFMHPAIYKDIAQHLDEKRTEREQFITEAVALLKRELAAAGVADAEIYGRPKHIYSIWNKMRKKDVAFAEVYDIRALRVIVEQVKDCYTALGIVHHVWSPIASEFDDYIAHPKGNDYRSLHTAVHCPDGRALEVQIRTREMHGHAELGVAAHWRYKEGSKAAPEDRYDEKIAWLRQLLTWRDEAVDSSDWVRHYKQAAFDETVYILTPQGRVVDLPRGATPVDFAYRVHTDIGHRCRGAKVDGALVPLNTQLKTGQRVEIVLAKHGGPSRDWLNPALGYLFTHRSRAKVRQWFASLALEDMLADGRAVVSREIQRLGYAGIALDELSARLGFARSDDMFIAVARATLNMRQLQIAVRGSETLPEEEEVSALPVSRQRPSDQAEKGILIVGIDRLLTQLAGCCKPVPPDPILGFVTRGRGVSVHRADCSNFANMRAMHPERVIETTWGGGAEGIFAVDIVIDAYDRQGLLRDVSDVLAREKINVIAVNTQSRLGNAHMRFTAEVGSIPQLARTLSLLHGVEGVVGARRA